MSLTAAHTAHYGGPTTAHRRCFIVQRGRCTSQLTLALQLPPRQPLPQRCADPRRQHRQQPDRRQWPPHVPQPLALIAAHQHHHCSGAVTAHRLAYAQRSGLTRALCAATIQLAPVPTALTRSSLEFHLSSPAFARLHSPAAEPTTAPIQQQQSPPSVKGESTALDPSTVDRTSTVHNADCPAPASDTLLAPLCTPPSTITSDTSMASPSTRSTAPPTAAHTRFGSLMSYTHNRFPSLQLPMDTQPTPSAASAPFVYDARTNNYVYTTQQLQPQGALLNFRTQQEASSVVYQAAAAATSATADVKMTMAATPRADQSWMPAADTSAPQRFPTATAIPPTLALPREHSHVTDLSPVACSQRRRRC